MSDIEIARSIKKKKIIEITNSLGIEENLVDRYGEYKAKIKYNDIMTGNKGKLILVTAINPTPFG